MTYVLYNLFNNNYYDSHVNRKKSPTTKAVIYFYVIQVFISLIVTK